MTSRFFLLKSVEFFTITCQARRLSVNTITDYSNTLRKLIAFVGDKSCDQVTRFDIRSFLAGQTVCNKTLLNYHVGLSVFFKWLISESIISTNPMIGVDRPRPEKRVIEPIPLDHIKLILAATDKSAPYQQRSKVVRNDLKLQNERNRAMILFLLDTGVRVGELVTILKDKVDQKSRSVKVIGKGNKERIVYFSARTAMALWKYATTHTCKYLFATLDGRQMERNNVGRIIKRMCQRAGVPGYSPHDFRHTFAVCYLRNYPNIYALQQMLGHSSLDMVKRYLVLSESDLKNAHMHASPVENWNL
ncbi:MAG TPA: tyrosine-type recombinase/integrase [Anaerolineaceae bacterium]|nr:tyrosine-type recombinase/integrase [Anaerolineaceae bacterium]